MKMFKRYIAASLLALVAPVASAVPILSFDDGTIEQTGQIFYDGVGGGLRGFNIEFNSVFGQDTPLNDGTPLDCVGCLLNFETGSLISFDGFSSYEWGLGGSLTITGEIWDGGSLIASGLLVEGSFLGAGAEVSAAQGRFISIGLDSKNPDLLDFYGLGGYEGLFLNSELALASCGQGGIPSSFGCGVTNADFDNLLRARVPEPAQLSLMGIGLLAMGLATRRRKRV